MLARGVPERLPVAAGPVQGEWNVVPFGLHWQGASTLLLKVMDQALTAGLDFPVSGPVGHSTARQVRARGLGPGPPADPLTRRRAVASPTATMAPGEQTRRVNRSSSNQGWPRRAEALTRSLRRRPTGTSRIRDLACR